jgi:hypothetical protein
MVAWWVDLKIQFVFASVSHKVDSFARLDCNSLLRMGFGLVNTQMVHCLIGDALG